MSKSEAGLQNCISKLGKYCDDWYLEVNYDKSKVKFLIKQANFIKRSLPTKTKNWKVSENTDI